MSFPGVTVPQANVGKAAEVGGILTGVSGILGPVGPALAAVGGLSSMFGGGASSDIARAGGTFYTGEMSYAGSGEAFDTSTLIIVAVVVLGLLIIFKGKK